MASKRKSNNDPEPVQPPQLSPDKGIVLIKRQIEAGEKIIAGTKIDEAEYRGWENATRNYLHKAFGFSHPNADRFKEIGRIWTAPFDASPAYWDSVFREFLRDQLVCLRSYIGELETELEFFQPTSESNQSEAIAKNPISRKVFIVHGHDQALKTDVERFIHQIGLEPVVLHRQPDKGQTIIEKFEENSNVGYAFILLTPDEFAYTADQEKLADGSRTKEKRARPNVIFEFGFFVGKLGRQRVCCIYKEGVVLPSDLTGLIYKRVADSIDSQAYSIIQELKAAGYKIQV